MNLGRKIVLSFIAVIVVFGSVSGFATSYLLDARMKHEVATSEVMFARSLSLRVFKQVRDHNAIQITDLLFDEQQLRPEKLEYLLVVDKAGKVLAHTFLSPIPQPIRDIAQGSLKTEASSIRAVDTPAVFVTDVAVPILEGIEPIGSVHVGLKGEYLDALKVDVKRLTLAAVIGVGLLATGIALFLARVIVRPLKSLTAVAVELSNANLDVKIPEVKTNDEIRDLAEAMRGVMAALSTLMAEIERQANPAQSGTSIPAAPQASEAE